MSNMDLTIHSCPPGDWKISWYPFNAGHSGCLHQHKEPSRHSILNPVLLGEFVAFSMAKPMAHSSSWWYLCSEAQKSTRPLTTIWTARLEIQTGVQHGSTVFGLSESFRPEKVVKARVARKKVQLLLKETIFKTKADTPYPSSHH